MEPQTKIILNGKEILLEDSPEQLTLEFFDLLFRDAKELVINDDGGEKFESRLEEFRINKGETFKGKWYFVVNEKSRSLLSEVLLHYSKVQWGFFTFSLIGDDFKINFQDVSDEMVEPEYAKQGILGVFEIEVKGKSLELIESLLETNVFKE
ncbi:MAG: hypothetical protein U9Q06_04515 [Nanoarchaeota archaeon]|nr:hypothetical protein [Nanoarchaeota archaeon]